MFLGGDILYSTPLQRKLHPVHYIFICSCGTMKVRENSGVFPSRVSGILTCSLTLYSICSVQTKLLRKTQNSF